MDLLKVKERIPTERCAENELRLSEQIKRGTHRYAVPAYEVIFPLVA